MRYLVYLMTLLFVGTAIAQNPTIVQGNYITNVFGNSNFVLNPNALTNVANVTNATRSTTTPLVATSEFTLSLASGANATWTLRAFDGGMKGQNCEARFTYRGFATATTKAEIVQNSLVVASLTLTPTTDPRIASINFPCGDLANLTTFRIAQTTANMTGTNEIGGIYVGLATNMANVAQAENVVQASRSTSQTIASSGTPSIFIYTAESLDVNDEYNTTTGVFKAKRAGNYLIQAAVLWQNQAWTAGNEYGIQVFKNSGFICETYDEIEASNTMYKPLNVSCSITLAVGDEVTIRLSQLSGVNKDTYAGTQNQLAIYRFPSSSELVVTPERQNVFGSVTYRGSADGIALFSTSPASGTYTTFSDATWTGYRDFKGTRCEAPITGDNIGCQIKNMPVGTYKITVSGLIYETNAAAGNSNCSYLIHETGTSTDVAYITGSQANTDGGVRYAGRSVIGTFKNTAVADRNFVFRAAKTFDNTSGNTGACNIFTSISGNDKSDFNIIIEPLDQPSNSALYVQGPVKAAETGAAIGAGYVGEIIAGASDTAVSVAASNTTKSVTTLTLNPGVYLITGVVYLDPTGMTVTRAQWSLCSTVVINCADTNSVFGFNYGDGSQTTSGGYYISNISIPWRVTSTTTYNINANYTYTGSPGATPLRAVVRATRLN